MTFICNTATFTLIMSVLQITEKCKEHYVDTLASCSYDEESFLLEFLVAVSLLMIMLQSNSSLYFGLLP